MGKDLKNKDLGVGLRQRTDGRYEARAKVNNININLYDISLKNLIKNFADEKQKAQQNIDSKLKKITLNEWFDEWFDKYKTPNIKVSSVYPMRSKYYRIFGDRIGDLCVSNIRNIDIQNVIIQLKNDGVASSSIKEALGRLRECLESAKINRIININPCFDINVKWDLKTKLRRFLSVTEQDNFLLEAEYSWYKEMFYIMFLTGLRVGEVGGLKWGDVDFNNKCIKIDRSLCCQYEHGIKVIRMNTPKTLNSYRVIPFIGEAEQMFLSQKSKQEKLKKELGDRWRSEGEFDDLVFTSTMGSPIIRHIAQKEIKNIVNAINLKESYDAINKQREPKSLEPVYPHAIRHTFCCRCFEAGMSPKVVQTLMGHQHYSTTIDIYTHVTHDTVVDEVSKFGNAITQLVSVPNLKIVVPNILANTKQHSS